MSTIRDFFLRARAWQVFALVFCPILLDLTVPAYPSKVLSVALGVFGMAWYWVVGSFLADAAKERLRMNVLWSRLALLYSWIYVAVYVLAIQSPSFPPMSVLFPLHLVLMACMFYALYFLAATLAAAESERPSRVSSVASKFLLIWFFPIGIWVIQPKINRLYVRKVHVSAT